MNTSDSKLSEQDVLFAFSEEEERDAKTLEIYLKQYPEYREALVAYSVDLIVSPVTAVDENENIVSNKVVEKAWSKFQTLLDPLDPVATGRPVLHPLADLAQNEFLSVAKSLGVSRTFLSRFRDGTILSTTIPFRFIEKISSILDVGTDTLLAAIQASPTISPSESFKSETKPAADVQITFDEAVETSGLSEDQKEQLKAMRD